jgi:hypothetical protein
MGAIGACSSFDEGDGATPPLPVEAGIDGPATDAPPTDSGTAPPPFCRTDGGTFCADFDDPGAAPFAGPRNISDGGVAIEDDSGSVSPPNAMRFTRPQLLASDYPDGGGCAFVSISSADFQVATSGLGAEFKIKLNEPPVSGDVSIGPHVRFVDPATNAHCNVYFNVSPTGVRIGFGMEGSNGFVTLDRKPVPGQWAHFEVDVHGSGASRAVSVRIDGVDAGDVALPSDCQSSTVFHGVDLGLFCVSESVGGDLDVSYDDIRVIAR